MAVPRCFIDSLEEHVWEYCDVGPPSNSPCPHPHLPVQHNHTELEFGVWQKDWVYENRYNYYRLRIPASCTGVQVVIVAEPISVNPDLYLSFEEPFPTGHSYSYLHSDPSVNIFRMTRKTYGFCGAGFHSGDCVLYLSTSGLDDSSDYHIIAYDLTKLNASTSCSDDCNWKQLGAQPCLLSCFKLSALSHKSCADHFLGNAHSLRTLCFLQAGFALPSNQETASVTRNVTRALVSSTAAIAPYLKECTAELTASPSTSTTATATTRAIMLNADGMGRTAAVRAALMIAFRS